jgi:hypothetical protein
VQQPQHPALAVADLKLPLDSTAQVAGTPGDEAIALGIGAAKNQGLANGLLALVQAATPARTGQIA